jgi:predicted transcriptional regulator
MNENPYANRPKPGEVISARPAKFMIELSPEAEEMLKHLIDQTKDSPSDIFRKALALYKVASESHREGLKVGATKSAESLEAEFVGF